jgi:hypothetical protein
MMDIPREIREAQSSFERAEKERDPYQRAKELEKAIDLLNSFLEENPDPSEKIRTHITNLRRTHTRRLLDQVPTLNISDIKTWVKYIRLLTLELKDERDYATEGDPVLRAKWDRVWRLFLDNLGVWSDDDLLAELEELKKQNSKKSIDPS